MMRIWSYLRRPEPKDPQTRFEGKCVIVTGSNVGLGFEAAAKLAGLGAQKVILGVRTESKGEQAKAAIEARLGTTGQLEVWPLDMNSYESVKAFAKRTSELEHLDVAMLNAGVYMAQYKTSTYGWEESLQVNLLSTAYLGLLLLPKLKESKQDPVLSFVNSGIHTMVKEEMLPPALKVENDLEAYNDEVTFVANKQYSMSKYFQMCVMQTMAQWTRPRDAMTEQPTVLVDATCPGLCQSELARGYSGFWTDILKRVFFTLLWTSEQGSRILVSGLLLGPEAHGQFWKSEEIQKPIPMLAGEVGEQHRKRIWDETVAALEKDIPDIRDIVNAQAT